MCGIAGALDARDSATLGDLVRRMTRALAHRGPDGEGFWRASSLGQGSCTAAELDHPVGLALGHRRLSIVDLGGGAQPMLNEDATVCVTFNGEIYNHVDLRGELERAGHVFRTRSDTEVLVHGWEQWGEDLFGRLNGIFAVAIADLRRREVVLARDPIGVKPLFIGRSGSLVWWSSELDAARCSLGAPRRISAEALKLFLTFRFIPSPWTPYEDAWKLPPSHFCRLPLGGAPALDASRFTPYASRVRSAARPRSAAEWRDAIVDALEQAVRRQLMADVPVASLLSGGVDSSLVTQLMAEALPYSPQTFGIGFRSAGERSEALAAQWAAGELGVPHHSTSVDDEEFVAAWAPAVALIGEPIANAGGLLVHRLCAAARAAGQKVVLTGQGADEPLGGYPRHTAERLARLARRAPRASAWLASTVYGPEKGARLRRVLTTRERVQRYVAILSVLPAHDIDAIVGGPSAGAGELARAAVARWIDERSEPGDTLNELLMLDARMSLADDLLTIADHHSMRASIELRVPFLDLELVELAERMPSRFKVSYTGARKWLYRDGAERRLAPALRRRLCGAAARRGRKLGFTTPLESWFASGAASAAARERFAVPLQQLDVIDGAALRERMGSRSGELGRQLAVMYSLSAWMGA